MNQAKMQEVFELELSTDELFMIREAIWLANPAMLQKVNLHGITFIYTREQVVDLTKKVSETVTKILRS